MELTSQTSLGLRNHHSKLSCCLVRNHQRNCFHVEHEIRQRVQLLWANKSYLKIESLRSQKSSMKLLPRVTHGFDRANTLADSEIINETASPGDSWIRHRKHPLRTQKSSFKTELLPSQKSSTNLLPYLTRGFGTAYSSCGLTNHIRKLSRC
jgi:hypothetical protein